MNVVKLQFHSNKAIITLNKPEKLNALNVEEFFLLASYLREVAQRTDVHITILTATGRGIDLSPTQARTAGARLPDLLPRHEASNSLVHISDVTEAFYNHPKLLIVALNGPVVGLTAALVAHADLIYSMPHTYLLAPFTKLGITPEGGATTTFIQRLGFAKANEALLLSKRIPCEDLARVGFVNEIFDTDSDTEKFLARVVEEVDCNFKGVHIASVLESKALIRGQFTDTIAAQTLKEALGVAASVSRAIHTRSSSKI